MADQDGRDSAMIITSYDVITSWFGRQRRHFQTYYLPTNPRYDSFYILGVTGGGGGRGAESAPSPGRRRLRKPGLNGVKF